MYEYANILRVASELRNYEITKSRVQKIKFAIYGNNWKLFYKLPAFVLSERTIKRVLL